MGQLFWGSGHGAVLRYEEGAKQSEVNFTKRRHPTQVP